MTTLVAIPFNHLGHKAPTLVGQALAMLQRQNEERSPKDVHNTSTGAYFRERFYGRGWSIPKITKDVKAFLSAEAAFNFRGRNGESLQQTTFFVANENLSTLFGEFCLWRDPRDPQTAATFDYIDPIHRGKGLSTPLFNLEIDKARQSGFAQLDACAEHHNIQSWTRLERLTNLGVAKRLLDVQAEDGRSIGRKYMIKLAHAL